MQPCLQTGREPVALLHFKFMRRRWTKKCDKPLRAFLFCIAALTLCAPSAKPQAVTGLASVRVASGLEQPLYVTAPPRNSTQLYIVEKAGQILILDPRTGLISPT